MTLQSGQGASSCIFHCFTGFHLGFAGEAGEVAWSEGKVIIFDATWLPVQLTTSVISGSSLDQSGFGVRGVMTSVYRPLFCLHIRGIQRAAGAYIV